MPATRKKTVAMTNSCALVLSSNYQQPKSTATSKATVTLVQTLIIKFNHHAPIHCNLSNSHVAPLGLIPHDILQSLSRHMMWLNNYLKVRTKGNWTLRKRRNRLAAARLRQMRQTFTRKRQIFMLHWYIARV
jgi:hypothetical protein